jgi:hypothetical protein
MSASYTWPRYLWLLPLLHSSPAASKHPSLLRPKDPLQLKRSLTIHDRRDHGTVKDQVSVGNAWGRARWKVQKLSAPQCKQENNVAAYARSYHPYVKDESVIRHHHHPSAIYHTQSKIILLQALLQPTRESINDYEYLQACSYSDQSAFLASRRA